MSTLQKEVLHSPRYKGVRLSILRLLSGCKTVKEFCEFSDSALKTKTFFDWEGGRNNGISQVGARRVVERAQLLGLHCTFEWLFYGLGAWPSYEVDLNGPEIGHHAADLAAEIQWYQQRYPTSVYVMIADENMMPEYHPGDWVVALPQKRRQDGIGKTCLVQLHDGQWLLRQVEAGGKPNTVTLRCANPVCQDQTLYDIVPRQIALEITRRRLPRA